MKGKVVAITGGAGGIGFEVARATAEAGADVALWFPTPQG
jgi:sorbose reductase